MQNREYEARIEAAKQRAHGRWTEILASLGVDDRILKRRNLPCPLCGGTDRFQYTAISPAPCAAARIASSTPTSSVKEIITVAVAARAAVSSCCRQSSASISTRHCVMSSVAWG